jgi:two-component system, LytTR family, sensor kinase
MLLFPNSFSQMIFMVPFWKTWAVLIVSGTVLFYAFYKIMKLREKRIREIEATKTELEKLRSENYRSRLEMEQINNFFSTSLLLKNNVDDILWDVCKNLIAKLGFEDCLIYMWNEDKTKMVQRAGFGVKDSKEILIQFPYDMEPGEGIVGSVAQTGKPIIVHDTSKEPRYVAEGYSGLSEIVVPIKYEEELLGVIDSEHSEKGFFNESHLQLMSTIATLMGHKIKSIEAEQELRKQKTELDNISRQLTEMQLAALRSQMNPHFIFNALNSIKKFVLTNEAENADKYLGKFSKLIRSILDNSLEADISLQKEIEMLKLYLELEKLRFGDKLNFHIYVDPGLAEGCIHIPGMIVQPFVENAICHGIMHKESAGEVVVSFYDHQEYLEINVIDDGVGRKTAAALNDGKKDHISLGIKMIEKRLETLKADPEIPSGIEIIDLEESRNSPGTLVKIMVPK